MMLRQEKKTSYRVTGVFSNGVPVDWSTRLFGPGRHKLLVQPSLIILALI